MSQYKSLHAFQDQQGAIEIAAQFQLHPVVHEVGAAGGFEFVHELAVDGLQPVDGVLIQAAQIDDRRRSQELLRV